ncbi:MAG: hypothetical protein M1831_006833 [Alyxoria varia]|nr:MAG: hypothetical protein M1831_006833 [Alyxoria varia]
MGLWNWMKGADDPLNDIDSDLRKFLQKQAPKEYKPSGRAQPPPSRSSPPDATRAVEEEDESYRSKIGLGTGDTFQSAHEKHKAAKEYERETGERPNQRPEGTIPQESLFQDGRYAHLWKNFRSQAQLDQVGKSDQEKLSDLSHGMQERQKQLNKVAQENCSQEQWNLHDCFRSGGWGARFTMCRAENRALEKCIITQGKFLRALGYMSMYNRPDEESERMQMHADKLYQRLLAQEKHLENAKKQGLPPPDFGPLIHNRGHFDFEDPGLKPKNDKGQSVDKEDSAAEYRPRQARYTFYDLPPDMKKKVIDNEFKGLEGPALELAIHEYNQRIEFGREALWEYTNTSLQDKESRHKRQAEGEERMSDKVKRWLKVHEGQMWDDAAEQAKKAREEAQRMWEEEQRKNKEKTKAQQ